MNLGSSATVKQLLKRHPFLQQHMHSTLDASYSSSLVLDSVDGTSFLIHQSLRSGDLKTGEESTGRGGEDGTESRRVRHTVSFCD